MAQTPTNARDSERTPRTSAIKANLRVTSNERRPMAHDSSTLDGIVNLARRASQLSARSAELRRDSEAGRVTLEEAVVRAHELYAEFIAPVPQMTNKAVRTAATPSTGSWPTSRPGAGRS